MEIKVLGPGCAKCEEAKKLVDKIVQENAVAANIEKVSDLQTIMRLGVLSTPAIVIDGVVKCTGRVPSAAELMGWLSTPNANAPTPPCCRV